MATATATHAAIIQKSTKITTRITTHTHTHTHTYIHTYRQTYIILYYIILYYIILFTHPFFLSFFLLCVCTSKKHILSLSLSLASRSHTTLFLHIAHAVFFVSQLYCIARM
jgi:hypothetical protein